MRPNPCAKAAAALAALALGAFAPTVLPPAAAAEQTAAATTTITVLGITDLDGRIERTADPATGAVTGPGAVTLACEVAQARESSPDALLVSSGDNVGGSTASPAPLEDRLALDVLNAMGVDASALGGHELGRGMDDLTGRILPAAAFPYLAANLADPALDAEGDGGALIRDVGGVKVGLIGVATDESPSPVAPAAEAANARAAELKRTGAADVVVVLAHADAAELAARLTGSVDVVLGGRSHVTRPGEGGPATVTSTDGRDIAVLQADHDGRGLAEVSLVYSAATREVSVAGAAVKDLRASDCAADAYGVGKIVSEAFAEATAPPDRRDAATGSESRGAADGATPSADAEAIDDGASVSAASGGAGKGVSREPATTARAEEIIVAPRPVRRSDRGSDLARTGASIGIGVFALGLVLAGTIFLIRSGRAEEDLDEPDDVADGAAEARTPDDPPAYD